MLTVTNIVNNYTANQTDIIGLVHLYRDASNYQAYSTADIYLDSKFYRGIIDDLGSWSEKWDIAGDNSVTQSTPSISIKNEVYPDGSGSVLSTLFGDTYVGNRAVVLFGYKGFALADFVTVYDGRLDDIEIDGEDLVLNLRKAELPATLINGREINGQFIGATDYNVIIPPESDGRFLPVPFGNHWNAPLVLYRMLDNDTTYWAYCDFSWSSNINTNASTGVRVLGIKRDNLWSDGTYEEQAALYIANEGKLVPRYQCAPNGIAVIYRDIDTGVSSTVGAVSVDPPTGTSHVSLFDQQMIVNVPLRLYRVSGTGHAAFYTNLSETAGGGNWSTVSDAEIDNILNDDIDDVWGPHYSLTNGTWSVLTFNTIIDLPKQLRSDANFCVNSNWPIHIPVPYDTSSEGQHTVLVLGKFIFDGGDQAGGVDNFRSHNYLFAFKVGNDRLTYTLPDPSTSSTNGATGWLDYYTAGTDYENYIGATFFGRGTGSFGRTPNYPPNASSIYETDNQETGYNFLTNTRSNESGAVLSGENLYAPDNPGRDSIDLSIVGDAGNVSRNAPDGGHETNSPDYAQFDLTPDSSGSLPYLRREALDLGVGMRVELRFNDIQGSTDEVAATFASLYLEAIESITFDWSEDKYSFVKGYQDTNWDTGTPNELVTFDQQFADETYMYLEAIIRRKIGAAAADMHSSWADIPNAYSDFFATDRTGSGFVTNTEEPQPFDEFVKEYCKYEPFTIYRDQTGKYKYLQIPIDTTSVSGRTYFSSKAEAIDYNRCDLGFSMKFTDLKLLCSEVKQCVTDYVYHDDSYAQDHSWKLDDAVYDYTFWEADNTEASNKHFLKLLEKKYTSTPTPSRVENSLDSTKGYCCRLTNEGTSIPLVRAAEEDVKYWEPLAGTSADWGSLTSYTAAGQAGHWVGWDAENKAVAGYWINQWCNRHRVITCASSYAKWLKYEIGDIVSFTDVPYTCLGLTINGFNGDTSTNSVEVNGQDVYYQFIITRVTKSLGRVELECMQLHELDAFITERTRKAILPRATRDINRLRFNDNTKSPNKAARKEVQKRRKR